MAWLEWLLMGVGIAVAWRVCRRGMAEMDALDASEESWKSLVMMEWEEGR